MARNSKPADFEQALAELETLVERLEKGDLPLEEALRTFERGVVLTRTARPRSRPPSRKCKFCSSAAVRAR